jgi:hypothetical protein
MNVTDRHSENKSGDDEIEALPGDRVIVHVAMRFGQQDHPDDAPNEVTFSELPQSVQREVRDFFTTKEWYHDNLAYATSMVTHQAIHRDARLGLDLHVDKQTIDPSASALIITGVLRPTPLDRIIKITQDPALALVRGAKSMRAHPHYVPISRADVQEQFGEGFANTTTSRGMPSKPFGKTLGETTGPSHRWLIYLPNTHAKFIKGTRTASPLDPLAC